MAATGNMIDVPLARVDEVNTASLTAARTGYVLMSQILGDDQAPLILASLPVSATAIIGGLAAYELTLTDTAAIYERIGLVPPCP